MRRTLTLTLISLLSALTVACTGGTGSGEAPPPETPAKAENTCVQPATPPKEGETPTCSDGCTWKGTECRLDRGVIIHQAPLAPPRPTSPTPPPPSQ